MDISNKNFTKKIPNMEELQIIIRKIKNIMINKIFRLGKLIYIFY